MDGIPFEQANALMTMPKGMKGDDLPVHKGQWPAEEGEPAAHFILACFEPTPEECIEIEKTGKVWLFIRGEVMPPVSLSGHCPFE